MITLGLLAGELLRRYWQPGILLFEKIFSSLLREEEKNKLTGATHLFISATITIFLFEKSVAVPAILTVTISDSMAAIAGKSIGRHPIFNKTLEGSVTFFCMTTAIFYFEFGHLTLLLMLTAGMVTLLEVLPLRFNDNLSIALATAFLLMLGGR